LHLTIGLPDLGHACLLACGLYHQKPQWVGHDGVAAEKLLTTRTLIKGFAIKSQRFNSVGRTIAGDSFNALVSLPASSFSSK